MPRPGSGRFQITGLVFRGKVNFGADTKHVQSKPFIDKDSTNVIERFHGTMKDRTNVIRGFKNMENANLLTDAWLVHYNFFKEHETLGNIPPAQKAEDG